MSNTSRFIRPLLVFLFPNAPEGTLIVYHNYIRKFAHFAEYAGLAFFAARAFFNSNKKILRKFWYLFALLSVLFVAVIDETNQSFNAARTGSPTDVLIDVSGGFAMILIFYLVKRNRTPRNAN